MKDDEAAPQGRPDEQHRPPEDSSAGGRDVLARIVSLRELVQDGVIYEDGSLPADVVAEVDHRLEHLEADLVCGRPAETTGSRCECGQTFDWPGLLERHRIESGHGIAEAA